jgi:ATP-binding cassette, subfamily C (CFTR/MRP), member 1
VQLVLTVLWTYPSNGPTKFSLAASALSIFVGLTLSVLSVFEHDRSIRPSAILNVYLAISIFLDLPQARTLWLRDQSTTLAVVYTTGLGLKATILIFEMIEKRNILLPPYSLFSPEALSGILNRGVFWWINALLVKGSSTRLEASDLFNLDKKLTWEHIGPKIRHSWASSSKKSPHSLLWATMRCFWLRFVIIVIFRLSLIGFKFCQPLLINAAVSLLLEPDSRDKTNKGGALIGATALIYTGIALATGSFRHNVYRLMTMIRGAMVDLIYSTTLNLDTSTARESAALTLMSTDIDRIASGLEVFDSLWASPIEIALSGYLLYDRTGLAFIAPIIISLRERCLLFLCSSKSFDTL